MKCFRGFIYGTRTILEMVFDMKKLLAKITTTMKKYWIFCIILFLRYCQYYLMLVYILRILFMMNLAGH